MAVNHTHTNQSGSVASFVIIGVVLVALVAGGVYLLQHREDKTGDSTPVAVNSSSPAPAANPTSSPQMSAAPAPSKSVQPAPSSTPKTTTNPPVQAPQPPAQNGTSALPKTGPSDLIPSGLAAAALLGSAAAFVQSQRAKRHLFER